MTWVGDTSFYCVGASQEETWTQGDRSFTYTFGGPGPYLIEWTGGNWIDFNTGSGGAWTLEASVHLAVRSDTGRPNNSPSSTLPPMVWAQLGCENKIVIPKLDRDGDVLWCRWAAGHECNSICGALPGSTLEQDTCTIIFDASSTHGYSAGWYPAALQIEDFPGQAISLAGYGPVTTSDPLSKIPLQFLVNVIEVSAACDAGPVFEPSMVADGACVPVSSGEQFVLRVEASQEKTSATIADIALIGPPPGMTKSSLQVIPGRPKAKFMEITWPIPQSTTGTYIPCLKVRDTNWQFSEQRCVQFVVSADRVEHMLSTRQPTGEVEAGAIDWTIGFNSEIFRPVSSAYIRVMLGSTEVYTLNAFNSSSVSVINGTVLQFRTPGGVLTPGYTHHVLMDKGVVMGNYTCPGEGPPWAGIQHQGVGTQLWTVDVKCPAGYRRATAGGCEGKYYPMEI
ncbi:uncharacterized protein LOC144907976 [Branchiostoma floridae x Branchiostoma belcheri]